MVAGPLVLRSAKWEMGDERWSREIEREEIRLPRSLLWVEEKTAQLRG